MMLANLKTPPNSLLFRPSIASSPLPFESPARCVPGPSNSTRYHYSILLISLFRWFSYDPKSSLSTPKQFSMMLANLKTPPNALRLRSPMVAKYQTRAVSPRLDHLNQYLKVWKKYSYVTKFIWRVNILNGSVLHGVDLVRSFLEYPTESAKRMVFPNFLNRVWRFIQAFEKPYLRMTLTLMMSWM